MSLGRSWQLLARPLLNPRALRFLGFNKFAQLIILRALSDGELVQFGQSGNGAAGVADRFLNAVVTTF